jgi:hypothetical protein
MTSINHFMSARRPTSWPSPERASRPRSPGTGWSWETVAYWANADHIILISPDISSDYCRRSIDEALGEEARVCNGAVDVAARLIGVEFDPTPTSPSVLV